MKQKDLESRAIEFKGNDYILVKDRLQFFNEKYENGSVRTEVILSDGKRVEVKASVFPDVKNLERTFVGHSQAVVGEGYINKTSALENAETSAVGRALAFMGIGIIDSVASADEMNKAGVAKTNGVPNKLLKKKFRKEEEDTDEEETEDDSDDSDDEEDKEEEPVKLKARDLSMIKPITQLLKNAVTKDELEAARSAAKAAKKSLSNEQINYLSTLFEETEKRLEDEE